MNALGWHLVVQHLPGNHRSLIGADERNNQIQLRAGIDHPADASKNSIYFSKSSKAIDVNWLKAGGLRQQFFVAHDDNPPHWSRDILNTTVGNPTNKKRIPDTFSSCAILAQQNHSLMHSGTSVSMTATYSHVISQFVGSSSPDECAPTADLSPCLPAAVGASNSISTRAR